MVVVLLDQDIIMVAVDIVNIMNKQAACIGLHLSSACSNNHRDPVLFGFWRLLEKEGYQRQFQN